MTNLFLLPVVMLVIAIFISRQARPGQRLRAGATMVGGSLLCGALGVGVVMVMPCSGFGSSFEGACGYGAIFTAIGVGVVAFLMAFVVLAVQVGRAIRHQAEAARAAE
ncbi:MAG: hypothetical protein GAK35_02040 [Herbaspirillum frisingense]|uniref:Uncharacterized protein n=1 Tax=Herbaspirillum frisingense TaxID=92645 RepID=A0A7V8FWW4_9BURK|nr:MAG: hypothetical protein GAK35_02040 [Herbaspirillum frisingense]